MKIIFPWVRDSMAMWMTADTVLSVEQLGLYANWNGSGVVGRLLLMCFMTSCSKYFMMMGVSVTVGTVVV